MSSRMQQSYIKGFDGLRAIAVLWVMFGHISPSLNWPVTAGYQKLVVLFANTGWIGVQLFFVLSGFLITGILLAKKSQPHLLRNFYIRRSLRIFPIYYLFLFFFFILLPFFNIALDWTNGAVENQIWYWTYLQNFARPFTESGALAPLWSLAIEEQYYLLWPLLTLKLKPKQLVYVCIFMVVSAPIFRYVLFYDVLNLFDDAGVAKSATYNFTFARWDAIAFGSLLAVLINQQKVPKLLIEHAGKLLLVTLFIILVNIAIFKNFSAINSGVSLLNQTLAGILFVLLVYWVEGGASLRLVNVLESAFFRYIGKYSYSIYLFHLPITVAWLEFYKPDFSELGAELTTLHLLFHFVLVLTATFALSSLSWHFIEQPLLKFKHRFS